MRSLLVATAVVVAAACAGTRADAQTIVITNADLGKPTTRHVPVTDAVWQGVVAREYVYIPRARELDQGRATVTVSGWVPPTLEALHPEMYSQTVPYFGPGYAASGYFRQGYLAPSYFPGYFAPSWYFQGDANGRGRDDNRENRVHRRPTEPKDTEPAAPAPVVRQRPAPPRVVIPAPHAGIVAR